MYFVEIKITASFYNNIWMWSKIVLYNFLVCQHPKQFYIHIRQCIFDSSPNPMLLGYFYIYIRFFHLHHKTTQENKTKFGLILGCVCDQIPYLMETFFSTAFGPKVEEMTIELVGLYVDRCKRSYIVPYALHHQPLFHLTWHIALNRCTLLASHYNRSTNSPIDIATTCGCKHIGSIVSIHTWKI